MFEKNLIDASILIAKTIIETSRLLKDEPELSQKIHLLLYLHHKISRMIEENVEMVKENNESNT